MYIIKGLIKGQQVFNNFMSAASFCRTLRIISLLSAIALTAQIVTCALADNEVKVYVNDTEMNMLDDRLLIVADR